MMEINGKYTNAIIHADIIDDETIEQVKVLVDQEFVKDTKIRIMPDTHAGAGCVIGTTMEIKNKIVPNLVGVDIGCGMLCVKLGKIDLNLPSIDDYIHNNIPSGMRVNELIIPSKVNIEVLRCFESLRNVNYLKMSLGSLGGGNHFIEIDKNNDDELYLIIHSGSRNLGKQVAELYQSKAIQYQNDKILNKKKAIEKVIKEYKNQGRQKGIEAEIKRINSITIEKPMPNALCYLEGEKFDNYMHDMELCQKFATENRKEIARRIVYFLGMNIDNLESFETIHNYINFNDMILRKGAISAYDNEVVLIPINMRDGCIIGKGKSNPEYNYSAPHGAGRIMSRKKAKETVSLNSFKEAMEGIYSSTVNENTLDESPFAYKPIESIVECIKDTVDIIEIIKPIYNFKADEEALF